MNGYDTVFANAKDEELEFETMFDQEDDLIDTIVGCNENGDPLTGADPCPAKTADERSCDDCDPDYEKDIDGKDTNAPKDAEGTVGYDFETTPEYNGKVDDNTTVNAKDVKIEEEGEIDFEFSTTIPKDAEGTVGYDFEVNPEIGTKDDDSTVDAKDVKIDEEGEVDFEFEAPEGSERTVPEEEPNTQPIGDKCCEDVDYEFMQETEDVPGIDKDVQAIEDPESYLDDDAIEDAESKDPNASLDYDPSDEEVIDYVMNN